MVERGRRRTHHVPPVVAELLHLILGHDCPHALRDGAFLASRLPERKLQLDGVGDSVVQLDQTARDLVEILEGVVTGAQSERSVQRRQGPSARRKREEIAVSVLK